MRRFKITKIITMALAIVASVSLLSSTSLAAGRGDAYKRDLTQEEIVLIASIFDADYYAISNRDLVRELGTKDPGVLFTHFITTGIWEEKQPSAYFNVDVYATRNIDLRAAFGDDIIAYYIHFATHQHEIPWRCIPTLGDAYRHNVDVYSVYDMVKGEQFGVKEGAWAIQNTNYAPAIGIVIDWK